MKSLVFYLEGRSEEVFLEGFLPRAFPTINDRETFAKPKFITFEGKQDLHGELVKKIRLWKKPSSIFIILQDQDNECCNQAKRRLLSLYKDANKPANEHIVRIACRELENWYLGDLAAVGRVYNSNLERYYRTAQYRRGIDMLYGTSEMRRITKCRYEKIDGSRRIAQELNTDYSKNQSHSFRVFCQGIERLVNDSGRH